MVKIRIGIRIKKWKILKEEVLKRKGDVICRVVENTSQYEITPNILKFVEFSSVLYTDEWQGYNDIAEIYTRFSVDHSKKQFVDGDIYTNTIEGFWSILKRGIIGIYHHMSKKHLQLYANEFAFRYNTRQISEGSRFKLFLCNAEKKLTYQNIIAVA